MPSLPSLQRNIETQTAVGVYGRLAITLASIDDHLAAELLVTIGESKSLPLRRPRCGDVTAPYDLVALHLIDVSEIGTDRDLQIEAYWILTIVGDVDVLVQPAINMAADHKPQGARGDRPILTNEGAVNLEYARCVIGDGTTVQQVPRFAIGVDRPSADHSGVAEIQPACALPIHLAAGLGYQHCLTLMDCDLRWADLNLERHVLTPIGQIQIAHADWGKERLDGHDGAPGQGIKR